MGNGIRANDPHGLNKRRGTTFHVGSRVRQETLEKGRRTRRRKCWEYYDKDEDNSMKTLNDKNLLSYSKIRVGFLREGISVRFIRITQHRQTDRQTDIY